MGSMIAETCCESFCCYRQKRLKKRRQMTPDSGQGGGSCDILAGLLQRVFRAFARFEEDACQPPLSEWCSSVLELAVGWFG